jgi:hypothetical protein
MRISMVVFVLLIAFAPRASHASDLDRAPGLHIEATVTRLSGDTHFDMTARSENPAEPGEIVDIRSRLEFPLDTTLLGIEAGWRPDEAEPSPWSFAASLRTSVSDPTGRMKDEDWVGPKKLAHTESDGDLTMILAAADVAYLFRESERTDFALLLRLDYQRIEQHLVGFEGWQGSLFSDQHYPVHGSAPVVNYKVNYFSTQAGATAGYLAGSHLRVSASALVGPAYASDTDDHLLRGRLSEGSGWGVGASSSLGVELTPGFFPIDWLRANLEGELRFYHVEGQLDERWYREGEDMPVGTVIPDLPHEIESLQLGVSLGLAASF